MIITRRSFLTSLLAAPIIIRPGILMPVKPVQFETIELLLPGDYIAEIVDAKLLAKDALALTTRIMAKGPFSGRSPLHYPTDEEMRAELQGGPPGFFQMRYLSR